VAPILRIAELSARTDLLSVVAAWIYEEWWSGPEGASLDHVTDLLRAHLVPDRIPLTLVASLGTVPVGTATLLDHDVGTEEWPELSPWLAAVYVAPKYRRRGIGGSLVNAIVDRSRVMRVNTIYLMTFEREDFYLRLGWQVLDRAGDKAVMSYPITTPR
jgi:GNAT superfamily N-acetyltransferase